MKKVIFGAAIALAMVSCGGEADVVEEVENTIDTEVARPSTLPPRHIHDQLAPNTCKVHQCVLTLPGGTNCIKWARAREEMLWMSAWLLIHASSSTPTMDNTRPYDVID